MVLRRQPVRNLDTDMAAGLPNLSGAWVQHSCNYEERWPLLYAFGEWALEASIQLSRYAGA